MKINCLATEITEHTELEKQWYYSVTSVYSVANFHFVISSKKERETDQ